MPRQSPAAPRLTPIVLGLACLLSLLLVSPAGSTTAKPARYPRVWNGDGTAQCYPDGCSLFGPCCS